MFMGVASLVTAAAACTAADLTSKNSPLLCLKIAMQLPANERYIVS